MWKHNISLIIIPIYFIRKNWKSQLNVMMAGYGTPLFICALHNDLESFKGIVEAGADLNKKSGGMTPLKCAMRYSSDIVRYIYENHIEQFDKEVKREGVGLAILPPQWMRYVLSDETVARFAMYARNVWNIDATDDYDAARAGIDRTEQFFGELGLPKTLTEIGIDDSQFEKMAKTPAQYWAGVL